MRLQRLASSSAEQVSYRSIWPTIVSSCGSRTRPVSRVAQRVLPYGRNEARQGIPTIRGDQPMIITTYRSVAGVVGTRRFLTGPVCPLIGLVGWAIAVSFALLLACGPLDLAHAGEEKWTSGGP